MFLDPLLLRRKICELLCNCVPYSMLRINSRHLEGGAFSGGGSEGESDLRETWPGWIKPLKSITVRFGSKARKKLIFFCFCFF